MNSPSRPVALAARHKLPAVYFNRAYVTAGGLISYAPDVIDEYRRAAGYVDRILRGEKPADLPVQAPIKYELIKLGHPRAKMALEALDQERTPPPIIFRFPY
jgi:hypothetical protein